jgi:hypothetical protein
MKGYNIEIKNLVKDNFVDFDSFRQGIFYFVVRDIQRDKEIHEDWYDHYDSEEDYRFNLYKFPVPIGDIGTSTIRTRDKAMLFMRWIRKAIDDKTFIKI